MLSGRAPPTARAAAYPPGLSEALACSLRGAALDKEVQRIPGYESFCPPPPHLHRVNRDMGLVWALRSAASRTLVASRCCALLRAWTSRRAQQTEQWHLDRNVTIVIDFI